MNEKTMKPTLFVRAHQLFDVMSVREGKNNTNILTDRNETRNNTQTKWSVLKRLDDRVSFDVCERVRN